MGSSGRRRDRGGDGDTTAEVDSAETACIRATPPPAHPVDARIVILAGPQRGRRFSIRNQATVGRSADAQVLIDDSRVSRMHARITVVPEGAHVEDLGSRNGTFVDDVPVQGRVLAHFGSRIQVGSVLLLLTRFDPLEEQLAQRQNYEAIGRLGTTIVHDLNDLLCAALLSAEYLDRWLVADDDPDPAEWRECITDMREVVRRSAELVGKVLAFSRRGTHVEQIVRLGPVVADVVSLARRVGSGELRVHVDVPPEIAVRGHPGMLSQLFYNLVVNAQEALPPSGGDVRIAARITNRHAEPRDLPAGPTQWVRVDVNDDGIGMAEDTIARMYEPFFTTKAPDRGSGLGLFIVFDAVQAHGGFVECVSKPGHGTRFSVYLAAAEDHRSPATARSPICGTDESHRGVVLVVDDEPTVRRSLRRVIQRQGHEVLEAEDGSAALDIARVRGRDIDLVVLDLDMPNLDGRSALAGLLISAEHARVLVLTGHCDDAERQELLASGADTVLEKPVEVELLRRQVAGAVSARRRHPADRE